MPGINFLFWNVNRKPLEARLGRLAKAHDVDVICLAECPLSNDCISAALESMAIGRFHEADGSGAELRVFSRLPERSLQFQFLEPQERWLLYRVHPEGTSEILLAIAHLPSKLNIRDATQDLTVQPFVADIEMTEDLKGHRRTVVVGDLNMNPFENGVAGAGGLHGVMTKTIAERAERAIQGKEYRMFYNPMWGQFGDRTPGPPGSYYRSAAEAVNYFWNTYDQVLVRPELIERLIRAEVLVSDGIESLLTPNGIPDKTNGSDHLPLFFRLEW